MNVFRNVRCILLLLACLCPKFVSGAESATRGDYKSPLFTVPYATKLPTIDGTVNDDEWHDALSVNAFQTTEGNVSSRPTTVWMTWDEDHFYIAMRSPLRPGERVMEAQRELGRDNEKTVFDDAYEIFLDFGTRSPDGEIVFFQYLGNVAGSKYDVMFEPTVGNSRPGWESGWQPKNRITPDGKFWEMELAIPRASVYQNEPLKDGQVLRGLFVRDFKRPWEQNNIGGSGAFSAPDSHCKFVLSKQAPAIHLLGVDDIAAKKLGALLSVSNWTKPLKWTLMSDGGNVQTGVLPETGHEAGPGLDAIEPGDGFYRLKVTSDDDQTTWLDWCSHKKFGDLSYATTPVTETGKEASLNLTFNPVFNYVRVEGDFIQYDARAAIKRFTASILNSSGKSLAEQELALDPLSYVHGLLKLGNAPAGNYVAQLVGFGDDGKEVFRKTTPFEKKDLAKDYPWWNTKVGNIERVIAPWTPMKHEGNKVDVWGRSMQVGVAGLPAQFVSQKQEMLAGPATLVAETNSGTIAATNSAASGAGFKTESASDHRVVISTTAKLGDSVDIASVVTTEFDGMYKVQLTLTPKSPTDVKSLKVVLPVKPQFAEFQHSCGEGIRYGFSYGFLPTDKKGVLWDSKQVDGQPMLVGSFIPYVSMGNDQAGLCWFADGDAGWTPNDKTPAIEIRKDADDHVDLVLNLISAPETLTAPRTITFAFEATPVKPLREGWRMDTWSTGDDFSEDFCQLRPHGGDLIFNAIPFTLDTAACTKLVEQQHKSNAEYVMGFVDYPKYHLNAVPYFINDSIDPKFAPASGYFSDQWHARVSDSLAFDKSLTDFIVWNLDKWCRETGIDGWYVDNVRPVACDNIDAGRGYRLPDGRIQPTYQMFDTRIHFLRVRATFQDLNKSGKIVLHMTNHMIMPWIGAADLALDGEDHVTFEEMNKDFIDFWSPARMRLDYSKPWGTAVTFLQEFQGNWTGNNLDRVMRAYTGMTIANDVLPGANPNGHNQPVWRGRHRFGIDSPGVTFHPYWQKDSGISISGATGDGTLIASSWTKPHSVLVAVVNRSGDKTDASLKIDLKQLGLSSSSKAVDADTGDAIPMQPDGTITVPVQRHDYRQVMIE